MEAKAHSSPSEAAVEAAETVVVRGVGLRVVGGGLDVKREVGKDLELCCNSTSKLCSLRFSTGELSLTPLSLSPVEREPFFLLRGLERPLEGDF